MEFRNNAVFKQLKSRHWRVNSSNKSAQKQVFKPTRTPQDACDSGYLKAAIKNVLYKKHETRNILTSLEPSLHKDGPTM